MRLRHFALAARAVGTALFVAATAHAGGSEFRSEFGEVRLQNLAIGKTYSVARHAAAPLVLRNAGDDTLRVEIRVVVPSHHDLKAGALPLPDRRWVHLERARWVLPAGESIQTDVRLTLPYDPDLAGKTFQVDLTSLARDRRGRVRGAVQRHRLLFAVAMDYRDDTEARFSCRTRPLCDHSR